MLEATAIELRIENLELNTLFRSGVISAIDDQQRQSFAEETQRNIRLANELRSFYFEEQNKVRRLQQTLQTRMKLFSTLDKAGLLEKIMKVPV